MKAQNPQSLSQTALCCALQDMTVSAGVIITAPRRGFYEFWRTADNGKCVQTILASILAKEGLEENDVIQVQDFKRTLSKFGAVMYEYFRQYRGLSEVLLERCAWLDRFKFTICLTGLQVTQNHRNVLPIDCRRLGDCPNS